MLLEIDDWRSVGDLQYRFNKCFFNLHLELYDGLPAYRAHTPIAGGVQLQYIRKNHEQGVLSIKSWHTKEEVELNLQQYYGLVARIFRQEGDRQIVKAGDCKRSLQELNNAVYAM